MARLLEVLRALPRVTVVEATATYVHAQAVSLVFRFVDDVEFLVDKTASVIHVRSASRLGKYDFGANRKRVERVRNAMNASESRREL